ncbi:MULTISPECIES: MFS transporter [unclassified Brevibacterium]|uniref:MFS transporter n=1 Tax=unclassified Brevibacterium TaxID=2614124 RepID=UPI0010F5B85D|nr:MULTISPECIES: MFS transporter [unclassified Brevibacterium]MCM1014144.1 MFS transporter [Brevibacterium sp. XM4083]
MHNEAATAFIPTQTAPSDDTPKLRLPLVVYVLALGTFLMLTTEFVIAGILPEIAGDLDISLGQAGSLITVFATGMVIGAPLLTMVTLRLSKKLTLLIALIVFVAGHLVVALAEDLTVLTGARFVTALATGAFWAVSAVVASNVVGSSLKSSAVGVVAAGGSLATVLGVPIGAYLAQHVGWRGTFWALGIAAAVAVVFVARLVPADEAQPEESSMLSGLADLRTPRLWLVLAACLTTTGGVLAAYSFIAPILTIQAGVSAGLVPLVLAGFGICSFLGTLLGGLLGDKHAHAVTIAAPALTTLVLLAMALLPGSTWTTVVLVVLLGAFGLSANSVLIHLAVGYAGRAATLGSGLAVAAFNAGTAIGTTIAGATLTTSLGLSGPPVVGTVIVALSLIPAFVLAVMTRRSIAEPTRSV